MIRSIILFISFIIIIGKTYAQIPITSKQLIGTWEIDYGSVKECKGGALQPAITKGRTLITFVDSLNYEMLLWNLPSSGYYSIDEIQGDIIFSPIIDQEGMNFKQRRNKVTFIDAEKLTLLVSDCGIPYEQDYRKVKEPKPKQKK